MNEIFKYFQFPISAIIDNRALTRRTNPSTSFFSGISERNNDYSDILDFGRERVRVVTFFVLEVPDYKSAMLMYLLYTNPLPASSALQNNHFNSPPRYDKTNFIILLRIKNNK